MRDDATARFEPFVAEPRERRAALSCNIGLAAPSDVAAIATLVTERDGGDHNTHARKLAVDIGVHDDRALFVARLDANERLVGFGRVIRIVVPADLPDGAPSGWYLMGLIVDRRWRRHGIGRALVEARLRWLDGRANDVYYVANSENCASIDLNATFGFEPIRQRFVLPGVTFEGTGVLFRRDGSTTNP